MEDLSEDARLKIVKKSSNGQTTQKTGRRRDKEGNDQRKRTRTPVTIRDRHQERVWFAPNRLEVSLSTRHSEALAGE
jgi:hypothetical protein